MITAASSDTDKQDATFTIRRGLADSSCYSFESRNFPGHYLRHSNFRLRKDPADGSTLYTQDATFCAQPGQVAGGVTLAAYNIAAHNVRHYASEVWIAGNGGPNTEDNPASYAADVTWAVAAPWAP